MKTTCKITEDADRWSILEATVDGDEKYSLDKKYLLKEGRRLQPNDIIELIIPTEISTKYDL